MNDHKRGEHTVHYRKRKVIPNPIPVDHKSSMKYILEITNKLHGTNFRTCCEDDHSNTTGCDDEGKS